MPILRRMRVDLYILLREGKVGEGRLFAKEGRQQSKEDGRTGHVKVEGAVTFGNSVVLEGCLNSVSIKLINTNEEASKNGDVYS